VATAWATMASDSSEVRLASPTAKALPILSILQRAIKARALGFLRKLIVRLVVTARGTSPMAPKSATQIETSASCIIAGPKMVPPGRSWLS